MRSPDGPILPHHRGPLPLLLLLLLLLLRGRHDSAGSQQDCNHCGKCSAHCNQWLNGEPKLLTHDKRRKGIVAAA